MARRLLRGFCDGSPAMSMGWPRWMRQPSRNGTAVIFVRALEFRAERRLFVEIYEQVNDDPHRGSQKQHGNRADVEREPYDDQSTAEIHRIAHPAIWACRNEF